MWKPEISIVIPVYNEKDNLPILIPKIIEAMRPLDNKFEVILVDDGSSDGSFEIIQGYSEKYLQIRYLRFKTNAGQTAAFAAGFKDALGEVVVTLDADLQNDPADIPKLLSCLSEYDVVCGWRAERKDTVIKKLSSLIANGFRRKVTGDTIHDTGCSLKVYRKELLDKIKLFKGMHRFLPMLLSMEGAKIVEVKVSHSQRKHGSSKYNIRNRLFTGLYDLFAVRWMQKRQLRYEIAERS